MNADAKDTSGRLRDGMNVLANAVAATLGPGGQFVFEKESVSAKLTYNFVLFFTIGPYQQQPSSVLRVRVGRRVGDAGNGGVSAPARGQYPGLVVHEGSRRG